MGTIYIGSARIDERGKLFGGKDGDQKQISSTNDTKGEVSMQPFYIHSKGWYILRPKSVSVANKIASAMITACNNNNIGYDQYNRLGIIKHGVDSKVKTEADCSSTVRACIIKATGKDVGNFNTANEASVLEKSGLFQKRVAYVNQTKTPIYNGDVLVTKTKGHTVIVVSGNPRSGKSTTNTSTNTSAVKYTQKDFIKDVQSAIDVKVDGVVGTKTLSALPLISKTKNTKHKAVKPLQKYLNVNGYSCGTVDGEFGSKTDSTIKAFQKANKLTVDGIVGQNTWKKLLGM